MPTRRGTAVTLVAGGAAAIVLAPRALALLARLDRLLADVERLVRRMNGAMTTVEETSVRAGEVVAEAQAGLRRLETALRPYEGLLGKRLPDVLRRVEEDLVPRWTRWAAWARTSARCSRPSTSCARRSGPSRRCSCCASAGADPAAWSASTLSPREPDRPDLEDERVTKLTVGTENGRPVELHYEDYGQGAPVVLIHGWPLSGRSWEMQVPALVDAGYRVVTYDRRGFGQSSQPWGRLRLRHVHGRPGRPCCSTSTCGRCTLVGFSMGGGEVVRYIATYGTERVAKAVLAGAVPPYLYKADDNPDGALDDAAIAGFEEAVRTDRLGFLEQFTTLFFSAGSTLKVSEPLREYAKQIAASASPKGTLDCIAAWGRTDFRADLEKVTVPTLVIHGDSDNIVPFEVSGKRAAASIGGSEVVVVEDGPHASTPRTHRSSTRRC
jgi:pimeloyl-ACP methyl ester carboxylesterase